MYLGIELGIQHIRAILVNTAGITVRQTEASFIPHSPQPHWMEQEPALWWQATVQAVQQIMDGIDEDVLAIGVAGEHGLVLLDAEGEVLRPAILAGDQRHHTDWSHDTTSSGASLRWLAHHEPDMLAKVRYALMPKDWLKYRMVGTLTTDVSDASAGMFLDRHKPAWDCDRLVSYGVSPAQMPHLMRSTAIVGNLTAEAARILGLREGIRVGAGAVNDAARLVGAGVLSEGQAALTLGSQTTLQIVTSKIGSTAHLHNHAAWGMWYHRERLDLGLANVRALGTSLGDLIHQAAAVPAGSEGLRLRGIADLQDLQSRYSPAHLTRAIMERVALQARAYLSELGRLGLLPREVVLLGHGAKSALWQQIIASVLDVPVLTLSDSDSAARGAVMLAAHGCGDCTCLASLAKAWVRQNPPIAPIPAWQAIYQHHTDSAASGD